MLETLSCVTGYNFSSKWMTATHCPLFHAHCLLDSPQIPHRLRKAEFINLNKQLFQHSESFWTNSCSDLSRVFVPFSLDSASIHSQQIIPYDNCYSHETSGLYINEPSHWNHIVFIRNIPTGGANTVSINIVFYTKHPQWWTQYSIYKYYFLYETSPLVQPIYYL